MFIFQIIYITKKKGYITNTEFSDILRLHLLDKYGGIWIDSTAFLLKQIPNDILNADFFAYHVSSGHYKVNNWIIVSKPHNIITNSMKKIMLEYWKHEKIMLNYFLYHLFFDLLTKENVEFAEEWNKSPVYYEDNNIYFLSSQILLPYNKEILDKIFEEYFINKSTYRYDKTKNISGTYLEKIIELSKL